MQKFRQHRFSLFQKRAEAGPISNESFHNIGCIGIHGEAAFVNKVPHASKTIVRGKITPLLLRVSEWALTSASCSHLFENLPYQVPSDVLVNRRTLGTLLKMKYALFNPETRNSQSF